MKNQKQKPFGTTLKDKLSKAFHVIPNICIQTNELKDLLGKAKDSGDSFEKKNNTVFSLMAFLYLFG